MDVQRELAELQTAIENVVEIAQGRENRVNTLVTSLSTSIDNVLAICHDNAHEITLLQNEIHFLEKRIRDLED